MHGEDRILVEEVLGAYRLGCFPMADARDAAERGLPIRWIRPRSRAVLPLDPGVLGLGSGVHVPRRLARTVRSGRFVVTGDMAFGRVVSGCAEPRPESSSRTAETWIDARIERVFGLLHEAGHAHSVEVWRARPDGELILVGGVYGLAVGRVFCAESMFSRPELGGTDASKVGLVRLIEHCRRRGFTLIDTQFLNPHIEQFGVVEIDGERYQHHLDAVGEARIMWPPFGAESPGS
jgi:leucyl/phenylalanyl-tRNA--protein transferase